MSEILPMRDIIYDRLGNYYVAQAITGKKLVLVNAVVHYASARIFAEDIFEEHRGEPLTDFATSIVESRIEGLKSGAYPGFIYRLEDLEQNGYEIVVNGLYRRGRKI